MSNWRIGVDVGGTNTDAVVLDLSSGSPVKAAHKSPTTPDVTTGIHNAVSATLEKAKVDKQEVQAVVIGTTSFVNSLVERDASKLDRVAVIRLSGVYSRLAPPFVSFPFELRRILEGPVFFADGGLQVDGSEISTVDPLEIRGICAAIKARRINSIVIASCYAPIDRDIRQEELARSIVLAELPNARVTISKEVANIGLLQRENASILNAALLPFAQHTIEGFKASMRSLGLTCPLFLTSNDGTLLSCDQAAEFPIKTFSSGPTNSMRGASFLAGLGGEREKESALVLDVGGTTTEIGVLLPTGFPRQAASTHELCSVSLNFPMPHVYSIGLGGGSRVREKDGKITVGPDSVGYRLTSEALCFGGSTLTASDVAVAGGRGKVGTVVPSVSVDVEAALARIKAMVELAIDSMKTSVQDVPVYLVGGGAFIIPDGLKGVSKVHRLPFYEAANAVGAACAQVAGSVDTYEDTSKGVAEVQKAVEQRAIARAVEAGADPEQTAVLESECIPVAYTTGRARFYVRAAGPWTGVARTVEHVANGQTSQVEWDSTAPVQPAQPIVPVVNDASVDTVLTAADIRTYRPKIVNKREWQLSESDLEWISTGCYILGCGGGGDPHTIFLAIRELVRSGATVRVIDMDTMEDDAHVVWGGGIGSPEVGAERLVGANPGEVVTELMNFCRLEKLGALAAVEIGGGNGMTNMLAGSSKYLNVPVLDGDFMGRAYPTGWQTTINVYDETTCAAASLPNAMASGDGTVMFMTKAKHYKDVDKVLRAGCIEMGTAAGVAGRPLTKSECSRALIRNTVSLAWRIGKAVALARLDSQVGRVGDIIIDAVGGPKTGRVLFKGKIVELGRRLFKGHSHGEVVIQALEDDDEGTDNFEGTMRIPFINENLLCEHVVNGKTEIVAGVPDLISILDAQNGSALGTPDYKYGLRVIVLAITAAPQWTDTERGMELGSLKAFGYDVEYKPVGQFVKPTSVIEEYA